MGLGGWLTDMVTSSSGVTIDLHGKRVFVQHTLMVKGLEHALKDTEGIDLVDVTSGADGYRIRAKVNGKEVGALLLPELIRWSNGVILVNAATPEGLWSWDGKTASWTSDIAGSLNFPAFVRSATGAELSVTLNPDGAWLALTQSSAGVDLNDVGKFLVKQLLSRAFNY